jgi:hypothetical protein
VRPCHVVNGTLRAMRSVTISYPRNIPGQQPVRIGLEDVRAANDILIRFDFERNGWVIEMPSVFSWPIDDKVMDDKPIEVAFIRAWQTDPDDA